MYVEKATKDETEKRNRCKIEQESERVKKAQPYKMRNILINWIDYDVVVANFISFFGMELELFAGYLRVRKRQSSVAPAAAAVDDTFE